MFTGFGRYQKIAYGGDSLLRIGKGTANHAGKNAALAKVDWRKSMKITSTLMLGAVVALGACAEMPDSPMAGGSTGASTGLPQEVRDIAAPFQDLDTAVLLEQDNCYWYEHRGPVETTLLPLRTTRGNTICVAAPEAAPAAG